jgi:hypothetical protein
MPNLRLFVKFGLEEIIDNAIFDPQLRERTEPLTETAGSVFEVNGVRLITEISFISPRVDFPVVMPEAPDDRAVAAPA